MSGLQKFLYDLRALYFYSIPPLILFVIYAKDIVTKKEELSKKRLLFYSFVVIALTVFSTIGFADGIFRHFLEKKEAGAFYEAEYYETDYEALLSFNERSMFCIVHLRRETDIYKSYYNIQYTILDPLLLPYGIKRNTDSNAEFHPEYSGDVSSFSIGFHNYFDDVYGKITLIRPATSISYEKLKKEIVSLSGKFCGSKESDIYHYIQCPYAKQIHKSNLIYFQNEQEACVFGYDMCDFCRDHYQ